MRFPTSVLLTAVVALVVHVHAEDDGDVLYPVSFGPRDLPHKTVICPAVHRANGTNVDIQIEYVDINPDAERTILMVHGWPSLWHSWKYQIEEFKDDYHLLVPNLRGFARSTHPGDVEGSSAMPDLVSDLACVLEDSLKTNSRKRSAQGDGKVICMGHDWGTQVCYELARMRPDLVEGVVGTAIPYLPSASKPLPTAQMYALLPKLRYQSFLARPALAAQELNADIRRALRGTLRSVSSPPPDAFLTDEESFMRAWGDIEIPPTPFFTPEEEDYWVEQYGIQGFESTVYFYTAKNRHRAWEFAFSQGNHTISQPVLSILPTHDPVADWAFAAKLLKSEEFLPQLSPVVLLKAAHWIQLERPREVNAAVREWLKTLSAPGGAGKIEAGKHEERGHATDEL
ncbi:hypothetical protein CERSUDRAFT_111707 [Gelatoporia subvermispora B]|uniref:AB hydrolase-1 domain-containing protein n=1 Tax=Ceriporiopsis subvermispora (strain B) TaxID=914234 RepID=M2RRS5_CERS8|nr:hypothetical protein CERSUDRAFT_111707 [Gelatoporia subvermispora B]